MATIAHGPAVEIGKAAIQVKTQAIHVHEDDRIVAACEKHLKYQPAFVTSIKDLIAAYENTQQRLCNAQAQLAEEKAAHKVTKDALTKEKAEHTKTKESLAKEKTEHEKTKKELCNTQAQLETAKKDLAKEKVDHDKTKKELSSTQAQLEATKKELAKVNEELKATKTKLDTTLAALTAATIEIEKLKAENCTLRSEKEKLQTDLAAVTKKLQKTESDLRHLEDLHKDLKETNEQTQKDYEHEHAEKLALDKIRDDLKKQIAVLKERLHKAESGGFFDKENRSKDNYYIDEVIYGGKSISDQKVIDALLKVATVPGTKFTANNDNLGGDPWRGVKKILTIAYTVDGKALNYLNVQERTDVHFK